MHPDIAHQRVADRHAELVAEAAHQRLVREAKQARNDGRVRHPTTRRWWWVLQPGRALASK